MQDRVLVLAPVGRDARLAAETIRRAGAQAEIFTDVGELCLQIPRGAGALLLTQEALSPSDADQLLAGLAAQPPWSDLPVIVLVSRETPIGTLLSEILGQRVNATFLERPTGAATLVRAVEMALRARRRQYELRDFLLALAAAQEAEHRARAAAEEAARSRDEFLASVAHDLKNPLGAIKGYAQFVQRQLAKGNAPPEKIVENLQRINDISSRAVAQIDDLLYAARLQAGQPLKLSPEPADLVALIGRVTAESQEANRDYRIQLETRLAQLPGQWDTSHLERALANLLGNAVKYSPQGSTVTVGLAIDGTQAVVTVHDQGIGIPTDDLPHIFERFYRAANATQLAGTGLGLAGVRQIVEQHGGTVAVESELGKGTCVTMRLPIVSAGAADDEDSALAEAEGA
ncbi:MAG TPA: HAMP domain-containing sensor histidine kinase [Chloroflexota bacterium]|nr:HAMP domain-containing sensor histidine kinase [Chloroflexota bacterium]